MRNVTCNNCGWVHMGVTAEYALKQVREFNEYFDKLNKTQQEDFYGGKGASLSRYLFCARCNGNYKDFRVSKPEDCPDGCTISPILDFEETLDFIDAPPSKEISS